MLSAIATRTVRVALHCAAPAHARRVLPHTPQFMRLSIALLCMACALAPLHAAPRTVYLEEMSSTEVRDALRGGLRTIIVPVGGTEQNGPHMALGKHNLRAQALAGRIAGELGTALVAPVLAYVPEGNISPPTEHMRYAGTISIPVATFRSLLGGAARSFRQHGFTDIVLLGDSGNYQGSLKAVAAELNREWAAGPARVHFIAAYYQAAQQPFARLLQQHGLSDAQIGTHAGAADTALLMAVAPAQVWPDRMPATPAAARDAGVAGDPSRASAALGQLGVELIVKQSVAAIRAATAAPR
jgi:creatinine amidohydrolase/Fe(II)-dependent formamide hydrolase-like protein